MKWWVYLSPYTENHTIRRPLAYSRETITRKQPYSQHVILSSVITVQMNTISAVLFNSLEHMYGRGRYSWSGVLCIPGTSVDLNSNVCMACRYLQTTITIKYLFLNDSSIVIQIKTFYKKKVAAITLHIPIQSRNYIVYISLSILVICILISELKWLLALTTQEKLCHYSTLAKPSLSRDGLRGWRVSLVCFNIVFMYLVQNWQFAL